MTHRFMVSLYVLLPVNCCLLDTLSLTLTCILLLSLSRQPHQLYMLMVSACFYLLLPPQLMPDIVSTEGGVEEEEEESA